MFTAGMTIDEVEEIICARDIQTLWRGYSLRKLLLDEYDKAVRELIDV